MLGWTTHYNFYHQKSWEAGTREHFPADQLVVSNTWIRPGQKTLDFSQFRGSSTPWWPAGLQEICRCSREPGEAGTRPPAQTKEGVVVSGSAHRAWHSCLHPTGTQFPVLAYDERLFSPTGHPHHIFRKSAPFSIGEPPILKSYSSWVSTFLTPCITCTVT